MREGGRLFAQCPGIDPEGAFPVLGSVQEHEFHPNRAGEPAACGSPLRTSGSQGNARLATLGRLFPRHPPDANVSSWRAAWGWMLPCPPELSTTARLPQLHPAAGGKALVPRSIPRLRLAPRLRLRLLGAMGQELGAMRKAGSRFFTQAKLQVI